jgi:selenide,water dikinase
VQVLRGTLSPTDRESDDVIVGNELSDDAAVVRFDGDAPDAKALVLTTDVIAPIVDEPEAFGAIAAANALSDVYAMGGRPLYGLNLAFFPDDQLENEVLIRIMRGAADTCRTVGVPIVGGHTVRNGDLKYGLAIAGEVRRDQILANTGGQPAQALILSKALGTGVLGSAIKRGELTDDHRIAATESMTRLNDEALAVARAHGATSCTDVTGFGLLGHLRNIVVGSGVSARLEMGALPLLPGARALAEAGKLPGGSKANLRHCEPFLTRAGDEDAALTALAADAQTSGGLLFSVPAQRADDAVSELRARGMSGAAVGRLTEASDGTTPLGITLAFD